MVSFKASLSPPSPPPHHLFIFGSRVYTRGKEMLSLSETSSNYSFYLFNQPYSYILLSSYTIRPILTLIYSFHPTQSVPTLHLYTPFILHNPSHPYSYILLSYYTILPILTLIYSFHPTQSFV